MTTLMLGTGFAGCLGGDDGGDEPENNTDNGGDTGGDTTFVDSDGDGIVDLLDQCADTPADTVVDWSGCPEAADTDGDGVGDNADAYPSDGTRSEEELSLDANTTYLIIAALAVIVLLSLIFFRRGKYEKTEGNATAEKSSRWLFPRGPKQKF